MTFKIQTRNHNGKWKDLRFAGPSHSHIATAISAARNLDQDGLFSSDVRIVDLSGNVVVTSRNVSEYVRDDGGFGHDENTRQYSFIGPDGREYDANRNPVSRK